MDHEFYMALIAVIFAGIARGFSGFGVGMILVPILSLLYNPLVAVVTVVLLEIVPGVQLAPKAVANCDWRSLIPMSMAVLVTVPLGSLILVYAREDVIRVVIASLILMAVMIMASGWTYKGKNTTGLAATTGMASGLISGASSLGGLPIMLYYLSGNYSSDRARNSIVIFLVITTVVSVLTFTFHGMISVDIINRTIWLVPAFILAIWVGSRLYAIVSEALFKKILLTVIAQFAILMLFK